MRTEFRSKPRCTALAALVAVCLGLGVGPALAGCDDSLPAPLIGVWDEIDIDDDGVETLIGQASFAWELDGCAVLERFVTTHGSRAIGVIALDPSSGDWMHLDADDAGGGARWSVWRAFGDAIIIQTRSADGALETNARRRLRPNGDGSIDVFSDIRDANDQSWSVAGRARLERVE